MQRVLDHSRPSPFLTPTFLQPWAMSFAGEVRVGCWNDRELIFLHRVPAGWELLGGQEVADRLDVLGCSPEFWEALRNQFREWNCQGIFPNLAEDAWTLKFRRPEDRLELTDQSPYVSLSGGFEGYLAQLSKKQRHELRRKMRRAERLARHGLHATHDDDLETFLRLHRLSSPEKSDFMGKSEAFFRALSLSLKQAGMLRLSTLWDGTTAMASMYQILFAGKVHLYNSGFDPRFASLAPGLVLLGYCIKRACLDELGEFDFLRGTERYKYDLGGQDRAVYRLTWEIP